MRHIVIALLVCACALSGAFAAAADTSDEPPSTTNDTSSSGSTATSTQAALAPTDVQRLIDRYRRRTWHWQRVMGRRITLTLRHPQADPLRRIRTWRRVAAYTGRLALHPPHLRAWSCLHHYEGAWTDHDPPYYGGLQMDLGFQRTYGAYLLARKGTADHWTPLEQMWVAEHALNAGRSFWAWPNSARMCGLL